MLERKQTLQRQYRMLTSNGRSAMMMVLLLLLVLCPFQTVNAFGVSSPSRMTYAASAARACSLTTRLQLLIDLTDTSDGEDDKSEAEPKATDMVVTDAQGATVTVGAVVRVAIEGLKAFQINGKGQGAFDPETKEFVPDTTSEPAGKRGLILPVGLRGVVTKVYTDPDLSANFRIQAKFTPGKHADEYDAPTSFLMHFSSQEVEVVE